MAEMGNKIFLSCQKATELVEKKQITGLSCKQKFQLILHKAMCGVCKNYEKQSHYIDVLLRKRMHQHDKQVTDTKDLQHRIKKILNQQEK